MAHVEPTRAALPLHEHVMLAPRRRRCWQCGEEAPSDAWDGSDGCKQWADPNYPLPSDLNALFSSDDLYSSSSCSYGSPSPVNSAPDTQEMYTNQADALTPRQRGEELNERRKQVHVDDQDNSAAERPQMAPATIDQQVDRLAPSDVYRLLHNEAECADGPRPDFITDECTGCIFLERTSGRPPLQRPRRRKGVDKWKQRMELIPKIVSGVTCGDSGKGEVWVKSSYGQVERPGGNGTTDLYHMHELHYFYEGKKAAETEALRQAQGTFMAAQKRKRQAVNLLAPQPDWVKGTLFHLRGSSAKPATRSKGSGQLDLQLDPSEKRWIQFSDEQGRVKGGIDLGKKGPRFSGTSGDFAEYHPRDVTQHPFEEGDLVGFGHAGLTRNTTGMRQLGIISRQAIVVGSVPTDSNLSDTVAYIGKVPVKLRGSARKDDFLVPSGREDGTVIAASGFPSVSVGRALHDYYELQAEDTDRHAPGANLTWQLAEASVVPPVHSVRTDQMTPHQLGLVAMCCGMTGLVVAAEVGGRHMLPADRRSSAQKIMLLVSVAAFLLWFWQMRQPITTLPYMSQVSVGGLCAKVAEVAKAVFISSFAVQLIATVGFNIGSLTATRSLVCALVGVVLLWSRPTCLPQHFRTTTGRLFWHKLISTWPYNLWPNSTSHDEARNLDAILDEALQQHTDSALTPQSNQHTMAATCKICEATFVRKPPEHWKQLCVDCWRKQQKSKRELASKKAQGSRKMECVQCRASFVVQHSETWKTRCLKCYIMHRRQHHKQVESEKVGTM